MKNWWKRGLIVAVTALVGYGVYRAVRPVPVLVDTAVVHSSTLRVTADDDGKTRVTERYTISAPIAGRLLRTALDPGDPVVGGETVVAEFVPTPPGLLDDRSRAEAQARLLRAQAAQHQAEAERDRARADLDFTKAELLRVQELRRRDMASEQDVERATRDARAASESWRAADSAFSVAQFDLAISKASLRESTAEELASRPGAPESDHGVEGLLVLRAPVGGVVLRVFEESERMLAAGAPIVEIGDVRRLEIVADYLSQDAVEIRPGMPVEVVGWGAAAPVLQGRVRLVEPSGFTKVSALGVEEQRVNVIVDLLGDPEQRPPLGDGFRVDLHVVLWQEDDVLQVPTGALFRTAGAWSVYTIEHGVAHRRTIRLGRRNGLDAQVSSGLSAGDEVILYPSELVEDGARVAPRK